MKKPPKKDFLLAPNQKSVIPTDADLAKQEGEL